MSFKLDVSGVIGGDMWAAKPILGTIWDDLSLFTQGYIEAMLQDLNDKRINSLGGIFAPAFRFYVPAKFSDLAPETLARIIADCGRYLGQTSIQPHQAAQEDGRAFYALRQSAPDYFNGPEMAQNMEGEPIASVYCFPPLSVQLGNDGKVRFA